MTPILPRNTQTNAKLFEESAKRESLLSDRLAKLEKEGDPEAKKEAQSREFISPFRVPRERLLHQS